MHAGSQLGLLAALYRFIVRVFTRTRCPPLLQMASIYQQEMEAAFAELENEPECAK